MNSVERITEYMIAECEIQDYDFLVIKLDSFSIMPEKVLKRSGGI